MAQTLDDMKDRLKAVFNQVMDVAEEDLAIPQIGNRTLAAQLLTAASSIAQGVAAIEKEEREAQAAETRESVLAKPRVLTAQQ